MSQVFTVQLAPDGRVELPEAVRQRLALRPGDTLSFIIAGGRITLDRGEMADDPFTSFCEWSGTADGRAYGAL
jgi:bifunctional DNA-binding transcriptional regulator/antitoxin component of YhaV-PrlF toxin-antitoxin module